MSAVPDQRSLHVVMVVPPYFEVPPRGYGGIENVVADLTDALVERGNRVTMIGAGPGRTRARMISLWPEPIADRLGETMPELVHAALSRGAIDRLHADTPVDVVHDHTGAGPLNAGHYATRGIPTVVTMHGPVQPDSVTFLRALAADLALVAISDRQRRLGAGLPWLGTVHNALRAQTFPYRAGDDGYALFLGRFNPEKAPHLALDAAHAAGVPLVLAGKCSEPPERAYYEELVAPRLADTDRMHGVADAAAKRELLANARCLLMPVQWEEPFGMVMVEAMACGTPVVALRGGAVAEVVEHGVTGYVVDHPDELPAAIAAVGALDPAACRERVERLFGVDRMAAGYEAAYRLAIANRRDIPADTLFDLVPALDAVPAGRDGPAVEVVPAGPVRVA
ncbi:glycosyl transferase [Pilimelia anulata]|uniref:Glycosyl transferase n=1 Tax=Pilimelia anulata TaxID=53371 RepID=A0A8J3B4Y5_9ACTN|nr:glycosyltransferase family 4 protein [Pilimelia anulata]GGJ94716.1 glycosyl transferase [Pilimelia anulata]